MADRSVSSPSSYPTHSAATQRHRAGNTHIHYTYIAQYSTAEHAQHTTAQLSTAQHLNTTQPTDTPHSKHSRRLHSVASLPQVGIGPTSASPHSSLVSATASDRHTAQLPHTVCSRLTERVEAVQAAALMTEH